MRALSMLRPPTWVSTTEEYHGEDIDIDKDNNNAELRVDMRSCENCLSIPRCSISTSCCSLDTAQNDS